MRHLFSLRPANQQYQRPTRERQSRPREFYLSHGSDQILGLDWLANLRREQRELLGMRRHA